MSETRIRPDESINDKEWLYIFFNVLDAVLTVIGVRLFGGTEGNGAMQPLVTLGWGFVAVKLFLACVIILWCRRVNSSWTLWLGNYAVGGVVLWNIFFLLIALAFI